ncbi:MAG: F0F1 ATP synthase subunit delta [Verrucomicrobia bacterium]|nr:F0F1 ATP synthase subunit delta [Verrucomicrobiota bacterium]
MKISKTAAATARRLFGLCQAGGRLDEAKLSQVAARLAESRPRDCAAILGALHKLVRLDEQRRKVTVESAGDLDEATRRRVADSLAGQYGTGLAIDYRSNPSLIGGLRVRVGDDVLDSSVQGRLDRLAAAFRA